MTAMTTPRHPACRAYPVRQHGFTLIELIIVMVVIGVLGAMVATFIRLPVQNYVDAVARAEVVDVADTALRRFTRDVRRALPNSIRVSADGLSVEMLLTKTGGRYLAEADNGGALPFLSFSDPSAKTFTVVGTMPTLREAILPGDFIVVYNLGENLEPANAYNCATAAGCNIAAVTAVNQATNLVTLASNRFAAQIPPMPSPTNRFQVVTFAVTYQCDLRANRLTLTRYAGYAIQANQPTNNGAEPAAVLMAAPQQGMLAGNVRGCQFSASSVANVQRRLLGLSLTLGQAGDATGAVTLVQQVHADNQP